MHYIIRCKKIIPFSKRYKYNIKINAKRTKYNHYHLINIENNKNIK